MPELVVPFGEWLPDRPAFGHPGVTGALNVIPAAAGFRPLRGLSPFAPALPMPCIGATTATDKDGNAYVYAGTGAALFQLAADATTDRSNGGGYATSAGGAWRFAQFGQLLIATNFDDPPQAITLGDAAFADLGGSPPRAHCAAVVGGFVMLGDTHDGTDGAVPGRVWWSGLENPESWTPGVDQSDFQTLYGPGGRVQHIAGGEIAVILQERAVWRALYEGPPVIFRFDLVEPGRGTPAPDSVVQVGQEVYFLGQDGFYRFDGNRSQAIGAGRIDASFFERVDASRLHQVQGAADPVNRIVLWAWPSGDSPSGAVLDRLLIYDWFHDRWSEAALPVERLFPSIAAGISLDDLDAVSASLDDLPASLDSRAWSGGELMLAAVDEQHRMALFEGAPLTAEIESAEAALHPPGAALVDRVRPLLDGGSATVRLGLRDETRQAVRWGPAVAVGEDGAAVRGRARLARLRLTVNGDDWRTIQGASIRLMPAGER